MSESGRRFEGARFESFEATHKPDVLDDKTEPSPNDRCEAEVEIVSSGDPFDKTRRVDIKCSSCPLDSTTSIVTTDKYGIGVLMEAERLATRVIKRNCGKWKAMVERGEVSGGMPDRFLPEFKYTRQPKNYF